jgi:cell division protein FtsW
MPRKLTPDLWLFAVVVVLVSVGVVMVYSASAIVAAERFHDPFFFLRKQLFWAVAGFGCLWMAMRLDYRRHEALEPPVVNLNSYIIIEWPYLLSSILQEIFPMQKLERKELC